MARRCMERTSLHLSKQVQVFQNIILNIATCKHQWYPTNALHNDFGILKYNAIHKLNICWFIYEYVNNNIIQ